VPPTPGPGPAPAPASPLVGRGGLKLRAALELFSLQPAVERARAIDIGASTGGFTQVLLEAGARSVTAVEGGHDQLHDLLRGDARVTNLERTDWKTLSLDQAPGPFDFFTVDVSFVAARSMLRGLAFRLRDGADGVVLVKPQFELPDSAVRGGDVSAPALRQRALERFADKAQRLGFEVLGHADSPVAGGRGTIEILTHLRFRGRPETLPRPGQKRDPVVPGALRSPENATEPRRARKGNSRGAAARAATALDARLKWFAVVAPGAEEVAAREATQALPDATVNAVAGGVEIEGSLPAGLSANLELRLPTRVLLRLGEVRAREFGKLRHLVARLPWERFLPAGAPVRISASASRCRLYHTGGIDENVRAAIGDRVGVAPEKAAADAGAPLVLVRGLEDRFMISIDSSGERLHRRGWRIDPHEAPLRETLAACLLALAGWQPGQALVDPMCGAGTIPIEACSAALGFSPGADRNFAFESWPAFDAVARETWGALRAAAAGRRRDELGAPIRASDREAGAIAATRANAARAGVDRWLQVAEESMADVHPPSSVPGVFLVNPPYGRRLGSVRSLPSLYRQVGQVLRQRFRGWRAGVVVPDARLASAFQLPVSASHRLAHGGLGVTLLLFSP
jgi:putative N6-adenine-specific DNA methylase